MEWVENCLLSGNCFYLTSKIHPAARRVNMSDAGKFSLPLLIIIKILILILILILLLMTIKIKISIKIKNPKASAPPHAFFGSPFTDLRRSRSRQLVSTS